MILKPETQKAAAGVRIEAAMPRDVERIWKIYRSGRLTSQPNARAGISRSDVWGEFFDDAEQVIAEKDEWRARLFCPSDEQQVLVAVRPWDGQVEGVVWPNVADGERRLEKLYVAKAMQGLGVGSKLIEAAKAWHHYEPVWLKVASYNPAKQLYERHGFVTAREVESGYAIAGKAVPQTEMIYPGHKSIGAAALQTGKRGA